MEIESLGDEISRQNKKKVKPDPTEFENIILVKYVACSNKKNRQSPNTVKILYSVLSKSVVIDTSGSAFARFRPSKAFQTPFDPSLIGRSQLVNGDLAGVGIGGIAVLKKADSIHLPLGVLIAQMPVALDNP